MLKRISFALTLALLGAFAATNQALAAKGEDADEVQLYLFAGVLAVMAFLSLVYAVKWYFGLDAGTPPPEPEGDHGDGAHH